MPCPCGSGKKYKHCCLGKDRQPAPSTPDTGESLAGRLEAALAAENVASLADARPIAGEVMDSHNNAGVPEFSAAASTGEANECPEARADVDGTGQDD